MSNEKKPMIEMGGLWKNEGKNGVYFSGYFNKAKLLVFPNGYKKADNHPDFIMYITEGDKREKKTEDTSDLPF